MTSSQDPSPSSSATTSTVIPDCRDHCCGHTPAEGVSGRTPPPRTVDTGTRRSYSVPAMDCAAEESDIRRALDKISGIRSLGFHLAARTLTIDADPMVREAAEAAIRKAGFEIRPLGSQPTDPGNPPSGKARDHDHAQHTHNAAHAPATTGLWRLGEVPRLILALVLAIGAELAHLLGEGQSAWMWAGMGMAVVAVALAGLGVYKKGLMALVRGRLTISALMAVAVTGAFLIGQWPEAAMVMALYAIAEWIEARAVDRARNAIQGLLALSPPQALVLGADGQWTEQAVDAVSVGARIRIRPGERVALDGTIVTGSSSLNQASVTGESLPVDKKPGDPVFAGTLNETGVLDVEVTALAEDSTLARIIHAVEQAQGSRAPSQRFVDKFAGIYTPAVFVAAVAVALIGPWAMGWSWVTAVYKALVLLVIACPCALVISTPVTVVSGLAAAARRGILIKGGAYLEEARKLKAIALDKTGTITEGKPSLVAFEVLGQVEPTQAQAWAAAMAGSSDHPVSRAIAAGLPPAARHATDVQALNGRGIVGVVDGQTLWLANHRQIEELRVCTPDLEARMRAHEAQGRSVSILATGSAPIALMAVADQVKASSRQAILELRELGVTPVMLSGDNAVTVAAVAQASGITEARGDLLPEAKLAAIQELRQTHGMTAMSGDGINDAPALAQADIGVAMGATGTDVAIEAADVVVMNDDLRRIPETIRLSRRTHGILVQNIVLALGIKLIFLVLALAGNATMWMAVFADMGASLLVVFNGLRLLRNAPDTDASLAPNDKT